MIRRPTRSTLTDTRFPYTTLFRSNPLMPGNYDWPVQMSLRFSSVIYYFLLMALFALGSNSARAIVGAGLISILAWTGGVVWVALLPNTLIDPPPALAGASGLLRYLDPYYVRSEERRVGKECVSTCRSRRSPYH